MIDPDETIETLPGGLRIIQKRRGYRYSVDALLLAEFAQVDKGDVIIDLGTGCGILPLLLCQKGEPERVIGVEVQEELFRLAMRNIQINSLSHLIEIVNKDIRNLKGEFRAGSFDLAVSNPPFRPPTWGRISRETQRAIARHEIAITLPELVETAQYLLKVGGRLSLVYPVVRLADLIYQLRSLGLEPKTLQLVHHRRGEEASLALLEAVKGAGVELKVLPPKIIEDF